MAKHITFGYKAKGWRLKGMKPFKKIQIFFLQTQQIREGLAEQPQRWITKVEHEAEVAEDPKVRAEWTRLLGFLLQTLNSVMKAYDQVRLDEDIQRAGEILDEIETPSRTDRGARRGVGA